MPVTMSKKKPVRTSATKPDKPDPISFRPERDIAAALDVYRNSLEFDPGPGPIINRALRQYLISKGASLSEKSEPDTD